MPLQMSITQVLPPVHKTPIQNPSDLIKSGASVALALQAYVAQQQLQKNFEFLFNAPFMATKLAGSPFLVHSGGWIVDGTCGRAPVYHDGARPISDCFAFYAANNPTPEKWLTDYGGVPVGTVIRYKNLHDPNPVGYPAGWVIQQQAIAYRKTAAGTAAPKTRQEVGPTAIAAAQPLPWNVVRPQGMASNPNAIKAFNPAGTMPEDVAEPQAKPSPGDISDGSGWILEVTYAPPGMSVPQSAAIPASSFPPGPNEKEEKRKGKAKNLIHAVFIAADRVSEAAEIVDAFYDALPKDVKKKFDCNGFREGRSPLIDQAGQYGIDRADCKMQALFANWHLVDFEMAVENVLKNAIEDSIAGAVFKANPQGGPTSEVGGFASEFVDALFNGTTVTGL